MTSSVSLYCFDLEPYPLIFAFLNAILEKNYYSLFNEVKNANGRPIDFFRAKQYARPDRGVARSKP